MIKNWFCYQMAMFWLWQAHRVKDSIKDFELWDRRMKKSLEWIRKVEP